MTKNKKGFTIIEVVLVLAIAGLIFLMVFIALPALQRSQRNTRRRQDMARILSAFTEYSSNNNGQIPKTDANMTSFVQNYVGAKQGTTGQPADQTTATTKTCQGDQFCDPDGTPYSIKVPNTDGVAVAKVFADTATFANSNHEIKYYSKVSCGSTENSLVAGSGEREIAILYMLEGGAVYCGDNH